MHPQSQHQHGATHFQHSLTQSEQEAAQMALTPIPRYINQPIKYDTGPFQGKIVRVELVEIQKADLGRKFARRDRRPLDPPNVAEATFYEVIEFDDGDSEEHIIPAEEIDTDGLMCHVDLFPVVGNAIGSSRDNPNAPPVLRLPPVEDTKQTQDLWGATFSHAAKLPRCPSTFGRTSDDPLAIYFPYPDLSVQVEGQFFFRYRVFDIKRPPTDSHCIGTGALELPIMAEAHGGLLTVYSTKEFPGLKASTALTKHLSLHGIKVNLRETERKRSRRRKSGEGEDDEDPPTSAYPDGDD